MSIRLLIQYRIENNDEFLSLTLPSGKEIPLLTPESAQEINENSEFIQFLIPYHRFISELAEHVRLFRLFRIVSETTPSKHQPELETILDLIAEYDEHGCLQPLELRSTPS